MHSLQKRGPGGPLSQEKDTLLSSLAHMHSLALVLHATLPYTRHLLSPTMRHNYVDDSHPARVRRRTPKISCRQLITRNRGVDFSDLQFTLILIRHGYRHAREILLTTTCIRMHGQRN